MGGAVGVGVRLFVVVVVLGRERGAQLKGGLMRVTEGWQGGCRRRVW